MIYQTRNTVIGFATTRGIMFYTFGPSGYPPLVPELRDIGVDLCLNDPTVPDEEGESSFFDGLNPFDFWSFGGSPRVGSC